MAISMMALSPPTAVRYAPHQRPFLSFCPIRTPFSVRPEMVGFGFEQGLSDLETGGIAGYFEDFIRAKTPLEAKRCLLWMDTI